MDGVFPSWLPYRPPMSGSQRAASENSPAGEYREEGCSGAQDGYRVMWLGRKAKRLRRRMLRVLWAERGRGEVTLRGRGCRVSSETGARKGQLVMWREQILGVPMSARRGVMGGLSCQWLGRECRWGERGLGRVASGGVVETRKFDRRSRGRGRGTLWRVARGGDAGEGERWLDVARAEDEAVSSVAEERGVKRYVAGRDGVIVLSRGATSRGRLLVAQLDMCHTCDWPGLSLDL
jgi:hypothetical protein